MPLLISPLCAPLFTQRKRSRRVNRPSEDVDAKNLFESLRAAQQLEQGMPGPASAMLAALGMSMPKKK